MPYRSHDKDAVCAMGSTGSDEELGMADAFDAGLDAMERDGWMLVQTIPQHRVWDDNGDFNGHGDLAFIFHKPPSGQSRVIV